MKEILNALKVGERIEIYMKLPEYKVIAGMKYKRLESERHKRDFATVRKIIKSKERLHVVSDLGYGYCLDFRTCPAVELEIKRLS